MLGNRDEKNIINCNSPALYPALYLEEQEQQAQWPSRELMQTDELIAVGYISALALPRERKSMVNTAKDFVEA